MVHADIQAPKLVSPMPRGMLISSSGWLAVRCRVGLLLLLLYHDIFRSQPHDKESSKFVVVGLRSYGVCFNAFVLS
jgi:hypothetical protein